jgi:ribosomal protein S18 acetylase RimI-like enzyme
MFDLQIIEAETPPHADHVVALLRDYHLWLRRRYVDQIDLIDAYFDEREWESELADLKGHYGAPFGAILLALVDGVPAGCVMTRGIGEDVCEMKRLFVRPAFHGMHIARLLTQRLAQLAAHRGYAKMRLETGKLQTEAQALYRSLGFCRIAPYYELSDWFKENQLFFEGKTREIAAGIAHKPCPQLIAA